MRSPQAKLLHSLMTEPRGWESRYEGLIGHGASSHVQAVGLRSHAGAKKDRRKVGMLWGGNNMINRYYL